MPKQLHDFAATITAETDKAVLVDFGGKTPVWLPRSQIEIEPNPDGKSVTITCPQWLVEEKGIV